MNERAPPAGRFTNQGQDGFREAFRCHFVDAPRLKSRNLLKLRVALAPLRGAPPANCENETSPDRLETASS